MLPADSEFMSLNEVLAQIKKALDERKPFSLVRVGDGENIVLAQDTAMKLEEVLQLSWAVAANNGEKGVTLPNLKLRDELAEAINKADIVGIPYWEKDPIIASDKLKRPLTEAVFSMLKIKPKKVCHTFVNRVFAQKKEFWAVLKGKRIMLVGNWADPVKDILKAAPYSLNIAYTSKLSHYDQIDTVLKHVIRKKDKIDIVLISCGVNAAILAPRVAKETGKVALDFGKSLMFIVKQKAGLEHSSHQANENLLKE